MTTRANRTGESRTSVRRLQAEQRQRNAYYMRLAGAEFPEIAEALGYAGSSSAFRAVEAWQRKMYREDAEATKALNLGRLNRLLRALWQRAIGSATEPPDIQAVDKARTLIVEINKMLGLYEPVKIDLSYIRREAAHIGEQYGLSADEVIAAAEEIIAGTQ